MHRLLIGNILQRNNRQQAAPAWVLNGLRNPLISG
jgi:hypothetical protein